MAKKISGSDYYWFLPGKKKPFTGTTLHVAEVLRVEAMEGVTLQGGRTVRQVREHFQPIIDSGHCHVAQNSECIAVLDAYIKNGYGDELLRNLLANNHQTGFEDFLLKAMEAAQ